MANSVWFKSIEDFQGLNFKPSSLTKDEFYARELINYRSGEGKSVKGIEGFIWIGQRGVGYGLHTYAKLNRSTGATEQSLLTCNDTLFVLKSDSITITRTGGSTSVALKMIYDSGNIKFQLIQNSVALIDRIVYNGSTGVHYTVYQLALEIDALANFSCSIPDRSAVCSNGATSYQLTLDATHTMTAHDVIPIYDNSQKRLIGRRIKQIVAGPEMQFWNQTDAVSVAASTVVGPGAATAAQFELDNTTNASFSAQTLTYYYWQPVVQAYWPPVIGASTHREFGYPPLKSWYADVREGSGGQLPSFQNYSDVVAIAAESSDTNYVDTFKGKIFKYDGQNLYCLGLPTPYVPTTTATAGGSLNGNYKYIIRARQEDAQGNIVYSRPSEYSLATPAGEYVTIEIKDPFRSVVLGTLNTAQVSVTTLNLNTAFSVDRINIGGGLGQIVLIDNPTTGDRYFRVLTGFNEAASTITLGEAVTTQAGSTTAVYAWNYGFNCKYARVNGNQAAVGSLTVDTPHLFEIGDIIYINPETTAGVGDRDSRRCRKMVLTNATSTVLDWDDSVSGLITVVDNEVISNGCAIEIFRTTDDGNEYFFLAEVPSNSFTGTTVLYRDDIADADLEEQFIDQDFGQEFDPPGRGALLGLHQGCLVARDESNTLKWSLPGEYEYFPLATNSIDIPSNVSGNIAGFISDKDSRIAIFKDNAHYSLEGDITLPGGATITVISEGDYGISSHASLVLTKGFILGVGPLGLVALQGGEYIPQIGDSITPFILNNSTLTLAKSFAINDSQYREYSVSLVTAPSVSESSLEASPKVFSFDYWSQPRWFERRYGTNIMRGGAAVYNNKLHILSHSNDSGSSIPEYCYVRRSVGLTTDQSDKVASNYIGATVISNTFSPQWFHGGEPSLYKQFVRLAIWSVPSDYESRLPFTLAVTGYRDFITSTSYDSFTMDFSSTSTIRVVAHLLGTKSLSLSCSFVSATAGYIPFITGVEMIVKPIYQKDDILP